MIDWLNSNAALIAVSISVVALIAALVPAVQAIRENNRTRDFASIQSLRQSSYETTVVLREKAIDKNVSDEEYEFHARHFLDVLEFAAYTVNCALVGGEARDFLSDWLKGEVLQIHASNYLKRLVQQKPLGDPEYKELRAFCGRRGLTILDALVDETVSVDQPIHHIPGAAKKRVVVKRFST